MVLDEKDKKCDVCFNQNACEMKMKRVCEHALCYTCSFIEAAKNLLANARMDLAPDEKAIYSFVCCTRYAEVDLQDIIDWLKKAEEMKDQEVPPNTPRKPFEKCEIHGNDASIYCEDCNAVFCEQCKSQNPKQHSDHRKLHLSDAMLEKGVKKVQKISDKLDGIQLPEKHYEDLLAKLDKYYNETRKKNYRTI